jgi:hypothetical protein
MLWVIKNGTGVLYFVATAMVIPIVSLMSTSPWYSSLGLQTVSFSAWQVLGLVLVVAGNSLYVYFLWRMMVFEAGHRNAARSMKDLANTGHDEFSPPEYDDPLTDEEFYEEEDWDGEGGNHGEHGTLDDDDDDGGADGGGERAGSSGGSVQRQHFGSWVGVYDGTSNDLRGYDRSVYVNE